MVRQVPRYGNDAGRDAPSSLDSAGGLLPDSLAGARPQRETPVDAVGAARHEDNPLGSAARGLTHLGEPQPANQGASQSHVCPGGGGAVHVGGGGPVHWQEVTDRLKPAFDELVATVRAQDPHILGGAGADAPGNETYRMIATFTRSESQEFEDVIVLLVVAPNDAVRLAAGGRPFFADATDRDIMRFTIETGTGEEVAALDPILLPRDEATSEYEGAVFSYVEKSLASLQANGARILEALSAGGP